MNEAALRSRVLRRGLATTLVSRGTAAIVPLIMVPLALTHLGARDYGAWQAALALTAVVAFADLGIGTGVMTKLGRANHERGFRESQKIIASGYAMVSLASIALLAILLLFSCFVSWSAILGVRQEDQTDSLDLIVLLTLASVFVNMVTSLIVRVQYGLNQQARSNLWQTAGSFAGLIAVYVSTEMSISSPGLVALAMFTPPAVATLNTVMFFYVSRVGREVRPKLADISRSSLRTLLSLGLKFFLVSLLSTVAISLDPWIVARVTTLETVPDYSIAARIFSTMGTTVALMSASLWPLHAQAIAAGDRDWIAQISKKMAIRLTAALAALSVLAILTGPTIIDWWLDGQIAFDLGLWVSLACWWLILAAAGPYFMVQNGGEVLGPQIIGYAAFSAIVLPAKFWLGSAFGPIAIVWTGTVAYLLLAIPACVIGYRVTLRRITERKKADIPKVVATNE